MVVPINWLIFFFMSWSLGTVYSGMIEGRYLGSNYEASIWYPFFDTWGQSDIGFFEKIWSLATNFEAYESIFNMFTWNYAMFNGGVEELARIPLIVISAAYGFCLIMTGARLLRGGG